MVRRLMRWLGFTGVNDAVRCGDDWTTIDKIERLSVFRIGEHQMEAHTLTCPETEERARLVGAKPFKTSRETLGMDFYTVYEHSCIRDGM